MHDIEYDTTISHGRTIKEHGIAGSPVWTVPALRTGFDTLDDGPVSGEGHHQAADTRPGPGANVQSRFLSGAPVPVPAETGGATFGRCSTRSSSCWVRGVSGALFLLVFRRLRRFRTLSAGGVTTGPWSACWMRFVHVRGLRRGVLWTRRRRQKRCDQRPLRVRHIRFKSLHRTLILLARGLAPRHVNLPGWCGN